MPPKNAPSRKGPQFKPPRPVKDSAPTKAAPAKRAPAARKAAPANARSAATIISSDDEPDVEEDDPQGDSDSLMSDVAPAPQSTLAPIPPPIPAPLLARLLYENFEDKDTQIQKGAMDLTGKYIEIFIREAFARARQERERSARQGGLSDGFLQVEDLERVVPQLVLDF